ncbi:MAG: cellulose biosynthesis cyclic di-GMP-binding regulatory protein BcsB [Anaerolineales bacterium]
MIFWVLLTWLVLGVFYSSTEAQESHDPPDDAFPGVQIALSDLQYGERTLRSPYSTTDYTLRLPEGWHLQAGSFLELDFSYTYHSADPLARPVEPISFGNLIITLDGEVLHIAPIDDAAAEHARLRIDLPPSVFNTLPSRSHTIKVILDASYICGIPHNAYSTIHATSFFALAYEQRPIEVDLALYPRPFYQNAVAPDRVQFVLPDHPSAAELAGAAATSARLGALTYGVLISGTTDGELLERIAAQGAALPYEHWIVVGTPERNKVIGALNELDALPLALQERQLHLTTQGPISVAPGALLTYTLTVTNTTDDHIASFSLVNAILTPTQFTRCLPACVELATGEVAWELPSLSPGATINRELVLRASDALTAAMVENTATLLDARDHPVNVSTLTTTVSTSAPSEIEAGTAGNIKRSRPPSDYFFVQEGRGVAEYDGVVQMLVSPWEPSKAILILTGLHDEAVALASRAISSRNRFPGLTGAHAVVRGPSVGLERPQISPRAEMTLADLGYEDGMLDGFSDRVSYYFDIPVGWHLTDEITLSLSFRHAQNLDYDRSSLSVALNHETIATIALSAQTALAGRVDVVLPLSLVRNGELNLISVESELFPVDECAYANVWLRVISTSALHLEHSVRDEQVLDLKFFSHPFDLRPDLTDVLFALPESPQSEVWDSALRLAAMLGEASGGLSFAPAVTLGMPDAAAMLSAHHIIAVGRPSRNRVLQEVHNQLPQPFLPNSDVIAQKLDWVTLRFPSNASLGYIQLMVSPWHASRALLAVTGTTDEGVQQAADVLMHQSWALNGNLALIKDGAVSTVDTRRFGDDYVQTTGPSLSESEVVTSTATARDPTASPTVAPEPSAATEIAPQISLEDEAVSRPGWLIPLVIAAGLALCAILGIAWRQSRRRAQAP